MGAIVGRVVRHRLTHLVVVGAALALLAPPRRDPRDVKIDRARVTGALSGDAAKADPGAAIRALVEEEVLAREAERLGLGRVDEASRARLATIMRGHLEAAAAVREPARAEVEAYLAAHVELAPPPRVRAELLFFRGPGAEARARRGLDVARTRETAGVAELSRALSSDTPNAPEDHVWTRDDLARAAGEALAGHARSTTSRTWEGPFPTAWGFVVARITPAPLDAAALSASRARAREAIVTARRTAAVSRLVSRLVSGYRVTVDAPASEPPWSPAPSPAEPEADG